MAISWRVIFGENFFIYIYIYIYVIEYTLFPLCVKAQGLSLQKKYNLMSSDRNEWELTHLESHPDLLL